MTEVPSRNFIDHFDGLKMGIFFCCPRCARPLNIADSFAGQPGRCPNCENTIAVPEASEMAAEEFRPRLNEWNNHRQTTVPGQPSGLRTAPGMASVSEAPPIGDKPMAKVPQQSEDVSAFTHIATESQLVADGIANRFSSESPVAQRTQQTPPQGVWYIRPPSGGQFGPANGKVLRQWISEGRVTGDSYVWQEGWADWAVAGDVFPAVAGSVSADATASGNSDPVTASRTRTAYIQARKRRTMRNLVGLLVGTIVVVVLIVLLLAVVRQRFA